MQERARDRGEDPDDVSPTASASTPSEKARFWWITSTARRERSRRCGSLPEVVGEERDLGRLDSDVRPGESHRDADVCRRERRPVVDAVSDEGDLPSGSPGGA